MCRIPSRVHGLERLGAWHAQEYYQYDIYARVCIFYGFIHYVQSLCFYGLGHINIELRARLWETPGVMPRGA